jgi:hypothetical protein
VHWLTDWVAPLIVTTAGVFIALAVEREVVRGEDRRRHRRYLESAGFSAEAWESLIYDIRDWAGHVRDRVRSGEPLVAKIPARIRCPGEESLRFLIWNDHLPVSTVTEALNLLEYTRLLSAAFGHYVASARAVRAETAPELLALCAVVESLAQDIVHPRSGREDLLREIYPREMVLSGPWWSRRRSSGL